MLWYGRPSLDVFQDHRRACEYIFSIDTVSIRSDVRKNMAARPVRGYSTSRAYLEYTVPTGVFTCLLGRDWLFTSDFGSTLARH